MGDGDRRWLLLVHQLPSEPSKLRVKTWRRLQSVGAVLVKSSVYVLPSSGESREHFEWIRGEIVAQGGEAMVFAADTVDGVSTDELIDVFTTARRGDWDDLGERATATIERHRRASEGPGRSQLERDLRGLRDRVAQIDRIDFFGAPGRHEAVQAIEALAEVAGRTSSLAPAPGESLARADYRARRWLTRPRPGVDRMASAWLIRRFVDPEAQFELAERIPADEDLVPFDMFGVRFGHHGESCTFETLLSSFGLDEAPLQRMAAIVHALDLHSEPTEPETSTIGRLVDGLRRTTPEDDLLLERGTVLFEALYHSFRSESPEG